MVWFALPFRYRLLDQFACGGTVDLDMRQVVQWIASVCNPEPAVSGSTMAIATRITLFSFCNFHIRYVL